MNFWILGRRNGIPRSDALCLSVGEERQEGSGERENKREVVWLASYQAASFMKCITSEQARKKGEVVPVCDVVVNGIIGG